MNRSSFGYNAPMKVNPRFNKQLLAWFDRAKRPMPWRLTRDPYAVWISEIMLQQTQVATVIPYYERWISRFPDIAFLAKAPLEQVLKHWEGLGYYSRARNIHLAAQIIVKEHQGKFPQDFADILKLPGIGRYSAGAIVSIAFEQPYPVLDGNVKRVFARLFALQEPIDLPAAQKKMWQIAEELMPRERPGDYNQALMELGAVICVPRDPKCPLCPVKNSCLAFGENLQNELPKKSKAARVIEVDAACVLIQDKKKVLLENPPQKGLWAGLWQFPTFRISAQESTEEKLAGCLEKFGVRAREIKKAGQMTRAYTVHREKLGIYTARLAAAKKTKSALKAADAGDEAQKNKELRWVAVRDLRELTFSAAHGKICKKYLLKEIPAASTQE